MFLDKKVKTQKNTIKPLMEPGIERGTSRTQSYLTDSMQWVET